MPLKRVRDKRASHFSPIMTWLVVPFLFVVMVVMTAGAGEPDVASAGGSERPSLSLEEVPAGAILEDAGVPDLDPPDVEWLTGEDGRQFYLLKLSKDEDWRWSSPEEDRIRYRSFESYDVAFQDEDSFYVKIYRATENAAKATHRFTPEELERIEKSYRSDTGDSDRLRLEPFSEGLPVRGQWRNGFSIEDMNRDGHPDIVHGPSRKGTFRPVVFLGDGNGRWSPWGETSYPDLPFVYGDADAADLNGDGIPDMVLAMHLQGLAALVGDGEGGFRDWSEGLDFWHSKKGGEPGFSSRTVEVADWNGDGRPDILALGEGPRPRSQEGRSIPRLAGSAFGVAVYLNQGDGSWEKVHQGGDTQLFGDSLAIADFNGDGRLDFATAANTRGLLGIVHLGQEDRTWRTQEVNALRGRALILAVTAFDFDGDGRDDLAVSYSSYEGGVRRTGIDVLYSRPDGEWERTAIHAEEGRKTIHALDVGDLDADGQPELIALNDDGGTLIFLVDAEGTWTREQSPELESAGQGCRGYHVRAVDLDGDGVDEFVEEFAGERDALFAPDRCPGQGRLRAWKAMPRGHEPGS